MVALPRPGDAEALLPPAKSESHLAAASRREGDRAAEDGLVVQDGRRVECEDRCCREQREHVRGDETLPTHAKREQAADGAQNLSQSSVSQ